jgi:hypothetical protein
LLLAVTVLLYARTVSFDFISWDDPDNVYNNTVFLHGSFKDILLHFGLHPYESLYIPLTYWLWGLLAKLSLALLPSIHPGFFHGTGSAGVQGVRFRQSAGGPGPAFAGNHGVHSQRRA